MVHPIVAVSIGLLISISVTLGISWLLIRWHSKRALKQQKYIRWTLGMGGLSLASALDTIIEEGGIIQHVVHFDWHGDVAGNGIIFYTVTVRRSENK